MKQRGKCFFRYDIKSKKQNSVNETTSYHKASTQQKKQSIKWKDNVTEWEKISANYMLDKGLISKICKKLIFKVTQSCPTLCDPMDYRVHGIL